MINKVFTVLTEFRFDIQSAVAETGVLQKSVEKISTASNQAMASLAGYAVALVGGYFSVWKVMSSAVMASEELTKSQLTLANIFSGQRNYLTGPLDTFANRMDFAKQTLEDMSDVAKKFSLPEAEMAGMTKLMMPVLIKAGVAGPNMGGAIDLSRKFLKASPTLGVDPNLAQGQLVSMLTGAASLNDTLFRRLLTETDAFIELSKDKNATQKFNTMDEAKRFKMISEGLNQFSKDVDVVQGMTGLLSSKMQLMRDRLVGIKGILVPLGEAVIPMLRVALDTLIQFIDTTGRKLVGSLSGIIKASVGAPKTIWDVVDALTPMYATMKQLGNLKKDVSSAGTLAGIFGLMSAMPFLWKIARALPIIGTAIGTALGWVSRGAIMFLGFLAKIGAFTLAFKLLGFVLTKLLWPLLLMTTIFQILSRASAIAKVNDIKNVFGNGEVWGRVTGATAKLTTGLARLAWPFYFIIDRVARAASFLFEFGTYIGPVIWLFEALASTVEFLADGLFSAMAGFQGLVFAIMEILALDNTKVAGTIGELFMDALKLMGNFSIAVVNIFKDIFVRIIEIGHALLSGNFTQAKNLATSPVLKQEDWGLMPYSGATGRIGGAFNAGIDDFISSNFGDYEKAKERMMVSNSVTNINKVEIRQDFKENQEPDRVAHSVIRALGELAKNPTQAVGRSMQGGLLSGT